MKKLIICFILSLFISPAGFAQEINPEIKKNVKKIEGAFNTCDDALLRSMMHAEFIVVNTAGKIAGPPDSPLCEDGVSFNYTMDVLKTTVMDNTGIAIHRTTGTITNNEGEENAIHLIVTSVWMRNEVEKWKLKHVHAMVPVEM